VTDRSPLPVSKKWGALGVINALFKVYFNINNLRLCQNLIRAVEGPAFPAGLDGHTVEGRRFAKGEVNTSSRHYIYIRVKGVRVMGLGLTLTLNPNRLDGYTVEGRRFAKGEVRIPII